LALTVVSVAYPIVPIGPDTVGGTEQVVSILDEALVRAGHKSFVVASADSRVAGTLIATPAATGALDPAGWDEAYRIHRHTLQQLLRTIAPDVVHLHGIDFHAYLPDIGPPVLATLHLPPFNYPADVAHPQRPLTFLNCVSSFSRRLYPAAAPIIVIANGVPLDRFRPGGVKEDFVLALGRIVPEKGYHLAIDAAKEAGLPLILGGKVPPFPEHEQYFQDEIVPRLDSERRFVGAIPVKERADLLSRARCLVVSSTVQESNPLVAMEALAAGTPVVARRVGALVENIEHGRTGLFANDVPEMAAAFREARTLDPADCRRAACERFSADRMARSYIDVYEMLSAMGKLEALRRSSWEHAEAEALLAGQ
jgi:glycosyltransferase involved in cell wall biosynthesis